MNLDDQRSREFRLDAARMELDRWAEEEEAKTGGHLA